MNKIFTKTIFGQLLILVFPLISISCDDALNAPTTISLRSRSYSFDESFPPAGVLAGDDSEGSFGGASGAIKSLTVKMSVSLEVPVEEVSLLDIPGVLNVSTRKGSVQDVSSLGKVESRDQNHGLFQGRS